MCVKIFSTYRLRGGISMSIIYIEFIKKCIKYSVQNLFSADKINIGIQFENEAIGK